MPLNDHEFEIGDPDPGTGPGGAPRVVVAGLSGDSGKTLVSIGLALALRDRGIAVRPFKKGPDYIDAAWLSWASGLPARNLDTWMAGFDAVRAAFARHASGDAFNLVEGNRGLFDGVDAEGTHSTAELAKALRAPVVLVVDARKATRTLAASVLGCQALDCGLNIAGVVLNRVAGGRHESVARGAIEEACRVEVIGAIPRLEGDALPGRHLGLVTPGEHPAIERVRQVARAAATEHIDIDAVLGIARCRRPGRLSQELTVRQAGRLSHWSFGAGRPPDVHAGTTAVPHPDSRAELEPQPARARRVTIGYLRDAAFSFYYPENLEALEEAGAGLVPVSSLSDAALPPAIGGLYIGGGFPEAHARRVSANRGLLGAIRRAAERGLPIYAECGGLMLLARAIWFDGERHEMAGVLPFDVEMCARPQGHGYVQLVVDRPNAFFPIGTTLRGHEFHYSRIDAGTITARDLSLCTACRLERGTGCGSARDAICVGSVWAAYTHLHAGATPAWARGLVGAALEFRGS